MNGPTRVKTNPQDCSTLNVDGKQEQHTSLTQMGVFNLKDLPTDKVQTGQSLVVQLIHLKNFDIGPSTGRQQIQAKYTLSDGITSIKALVPDTAYTKLAKSPKLYDVIKIRKFQINAIKD